MLNINFVPDDYVQKRESMRANVMYLILFLIVMIGLGGTFMVLKVRQKAIGNAGGGRIAKNGKGARRTSLSLKTFRPNASR